MRKSPRIWTTAILGATLCAFLLLHHSNTPSPQHPNAERRTPNANIPRPKEADRLYTANPKAAAPKYKEFIAKYKTAKDPIIQDQVGNARLKVGFLAAHQKDWTEAREAFLEADKQTKGTDRTGDFGSVNEQGAYEAIVCLEAAGKKEEAKKQYTDFIRARPLSPLCMACYRRLKHLNGGVTTPNLDKLIDESTKKQDANAKFESSVCGPKTIEYLLRRQADKGDKANEADKISPALQYSSTPTLRNPSYREIAKLCHTTETGTTIAGMIQGLKAFGVNASAYQVNRQDLTKLKTPAIVLWGDHYLTLLKVNDRSIHAYDTRTRSEQDFPIPDYDNPDFYLNTIILGGPSLGNEARTSSSTSATQRSRSNAPTL